MKVTIEGETIEVILLMQQLIKTEMCQAAQKEMRVTTPIRADFVKAGTMPAEIPDGGGGKSEEGEEAEEAGSSEEGMEREAKGGHPAHQGRSQGEA